jgi:hypothetical protein
MSNKPRSGSNASDPASVAASNSIYENLNNNGNEVNNEVNNNANNAKNNNFKQLPFTSAGNASEKSYVLNKIKPIINSMREQQQQQKESVVSAYNNSEENTDKKVSDAFFLELIEKYPTKFFPVIQNLQTNPSTKEPVGKILRRISSKYRGGRRRSRSCSCSKRRQTKRR